MYLTKESVSHRFYMFVLCMLFTRYLHVICTFFCLRLLDQTDFMIFVQDPPPIDRSFPSNATLSQAKASVSVTILSCSKVRSMTNLLFLRD